MYNKCASILYMAIDPQTRSHSFNIIDLIWYIQYSIGNIVVVAQMAAIAIDLRRFANHNSMYYKRSASNMRYLLDRRRERSCKHQRWIARLNINWDFVIGATWLKQCARFWIWKSIIYAHLSIMDRLIAMIAYKWSVQRELCGYCLNIYHIEKVTIDCCRWAYGDGLMIS